MKEGQKPGWSKWLIRALVGLFLLLLVVGVPLYFVWKTYRIALAP
jgi:phage shock protein PspC (stress-responsive transcriptional regulator)